MRVERILIPLAFLNLVVLILGVVFNIVADLLGIT